LSHTLGSWLVCWIVGICLLLNSGRHQPLFLWILFHILSFFKIPITWILEFLSLSLSTLSLLFMLSKFY
jgi:hypothetical protein